MPKYDDEAAQFDKESQCPDGELVDIIQSIKGDTYLDQAESLAEMLCTLEEIATFFKCSERYISLRMKKEPAFKAAIINGRNKGRMSLRRMQFNLAKAGNATMQIWLGKQILNQTDHTTIKLPFDKNMNSKDRGEMIFYAVVNGDISIQAGATLSNISRTAIDEQTIDALNRIEKLEKLSNGE